MSSAVKRLPILILLVVCLLGVGYAAMNSIALDVSGILGLSGLGGVYITSVVDTLGDEISGFYNGTVLNSTVTLLESLSSTKTYEITVYNGANTVYKFVSDICDKTDPDFYSNQDITYTITGIAAEEEIAPHASKTFQITFQYKQDLEAITNNVLTSCIRFKFGDSVIEFDLTGTGGGRAFSLGEVPFNSNEQTFFLEVDTLGIPNAAANENIISMGQHIADWTIPASKPNAVNLHIYYPGRTDRKITISPLMQGERHIQFKHAYSKVRDEGIMKIAFNANGLSINGNCIITAAGMGETTELYDKQSSRSVEEYLAMFFEKWQSGELNVEFGSIEGANRSNSVYNEAKIYKASMTIEEMNELTRVIPGKQLDGVTYADYIDEPYSPNGAEFDVPITDYRSIFSKTLYADMNLSNITSGTVNENIISVGHNIEIWGNYGEWGSEMSSGANLHLYYPSTDGTLIVAMVLQNSGFKQWKISPVNLNITDGKLRLAFNGGGLYINGLKIISPDGIGPNVSEFSSTTGLTTAAFITEGFHRLSDETKSIAVGSKQGTSRSTIRYDTIQMYNAFISEGSMTTLTTR